jgi:hypothetical protein
VRGYVFTVRRSIGAVLKRREWAKNRPEIDGSRVGKCARKK